MAAKRETARGPQTRTFNYFPRQGQFAWGGMLPDGNAGSLPPNRPRLVGNARLKGGEFEARGGQERLDGNPLHDASACITSLADFQLVGKRAIYLVGDGCPGISSSVGFSLSYFDPEQEPEFQPGVYYSSATAGVAIEPFGDELYLAVDTKIRKLQLIEQVFGSDALAIGGTEQDVTLFTLAAPLTHVGTIKAFDGKLFFGCNGGAGASVVLPFDGVTFGPNDLSGINPPRGMGVFRESLILGYDGTPNEIRVRAAGAVPGTWATVVPGAGTVRFQGNGAGVSYKDKFYIANGADDVYSFDGTTLTRITAATTGIAAGSVTTGVAVFNRLLYVFYQTIASPPGDGAVRIATFDGTTWTAVHKDITAQFGTSPDIDQSRVLIPYRNDLYAIVVTRGASGIAGKVLRSPGTTTTGTWTNMGPTGPTLSADIEYGLVH